MIREIKFRAFDNAGGGVWLDVYAIDFYNLKIKFKSEPDKGETEEDTWRNFDDSDDLTIIQSTGLFDKNGREIYEGDLLSSLYKMDGCNGLYEVFWRQVGFIPKRHKEHQQKFVTVTMMDLERCEIIGNIFENKDLLT